MVVHHIKDVDQAKQDCYQETHPTSNNIGGNDEGSPGNKDKQSRGDIVNNQVLVVLPSDVNIESSEGEVAKLSVIVQVQAGIEG